MDAFGQAEYVAVMVDAAEASLRKAGRPDAASRLEAAFANTALGTKTAASEGIAQLEADLDRARSSGASVQQAMLSTLTAFHIDVPASVANDVRASAEGFRPMTYAEFHAKPADEQRRIIKAYGLVGVFDYFARDIKEQGYEKSFYATLVNDRLVGDILDFVRAQFPTAGAQPGFAGAVRRMEPMLTAETAAAGQKKPFVAVVLYAMDRGDEVLAERDRKLDERAVMIPDGRLVYADKNGVFWTISNHESLKLEEDLQPLARSLQTCMQRRGVFNRAGLDACREEAMPVKGRLIFGDEVTHAGSDWDYANGRPIPPDLIDSATGRPPLVPKQQYSTRQAPVAGYVQQIRSVVGAVHDCQGLIPWMHYNSSRFDMDDSGVVISSHSLTSGTTLAYGAAIANLDLAQPRSIPQGSSCVVIALDCKRGACVRAGDRADLTLQIMVNSRDDVDTVLSALRAIAPYYPDGLGELK